MKTDQAKTYEAPTVRILGTVQSLTQWKFPKQWGGSDGFMHMPISWTS